MKLAALALLLIFALVACDSNSTENQPPDIVRITVTPNPVEANQKATLTAIATDADGDALDYFWSAETGLIDPSDAGRNPSEWTAGSVATTSTITCTITDGKSSVEQSVMVTVNNPIIVGNWVVAQISDGTGDQTQAFGSVVSALTFQFDEDNGFAMKLDYNAVGEGEGFQDLTLTGTYEVRVDTHLLVLNVSSPLSVTLAADYSILNNNTIEFQLPASVANAIFNPKTPFRGSVNLNLRRLSGTLSFHRLH